MKDKKRDFKAELKEVWSENKGKIKVGLICFGLGTIYGVIAHTKNMGDSMSKLIDKIPYEPDPGDISEWIYSNLDKPEVLEEIRGTFEEIDKL